MMTYDQTFYDYLQTFAVASAKQIVPTVLAALDIRSVVDFGCGQGAWLSIWATSGAEIHRLDGDYVNRAGLLIPATNFQAADLARPIQLERRFDLVQSLEVAEHLPPDCSEAFIATLVSHASCVLFSAAVPGQGGMHHVNERPLEYWRALFRKHRYVLVDCVRPAVRNNARVQQWYCCNALLYIDQSRLDALGCGLNHVHQVMAETRQTAARKLRAVLS